MHSGQNKQIRSDFILIGSVSIRVKRMDAVVKCRSPGPRPSLLQVAEAYLATVAACNQIHRSGEIRI